ncbi:MAG: S9 family peptidase [Rhodanobacteraceae bacterium]|jgi:prolyl oligopeptidase|nr:S9 family peptidase [Rhodanobacteraceae bacterium]
MKFSPLARAAALGALVAAAGCTPVAPKADAPAPAIAKTEAAVDDPYLWLEDISGAEALEWVKARDAETAKAYAETPAFETLRGRILEALDSDARIPFVEKIGDRYYNLWKDKDHPLGLWRRTTLAEYRKDAPTWETVLDIDALSAAEGQRWVWQGFQCLKPANRRCLLRLSPGGGDAAAVREFDLHDKAFVQDGFQLRAAKSSIAWIDADRIYVGTDFGPGAMTKSSYPRIAKEWRRGTPLATATTVYEGKDEDMMVYAARDLTPGFQRDYVVRVIDFYTSETFVRGKDGALTKIDVPLDAQADAHREWLLVQPRSAWTVGATTYPAGSLLAAKFDDWMAGRRELTVLFTPTATTSLSGYSWTRHHLLLNLLDDVASRQEVLTPAKGEWKRRPLPGAPALSTVEASGIDADHDDSYFLTVTGYLTPTTLYHGTLGRGEAKAVKHTPAFFDGAKFEVSQHFVNSRDGTRVPYFQVAPKGLALDGKARTLLYGYGGFELAQRPTYSAGVGRGWLEQGGVYVVANIRGGGEYGPRWHQAALKANRPRAYEDFAAVADDLVKRGVTSRAHLGAMGGSNGGLLVGNMLTQYPDRFGAIVCAVPLLDMKRYTRLSAGASWIAEYGDPDKPEEWEWIKAFSPYQNLKAGQDYPSTLFYTATSDDRVGPVQARKMAAKMRDMGYANAWFYENTEGGHGGAADNRQSAYRLALSYTFLLEHLK